MYKIFLKRLACYIIRLYIYITIQTKGTQAMNTMKKHFRPEQLALFVPMIIAYLLEAI